MKKLNTIAIACGLFFLSTILFGQTPPNLGTASSFVLFTSSGAITNLGLSKVTGDVGTNSGACTGFGNVNGQMHNGDGTSASAAFDLNLAYIQLGGQAPTMFPGILLGGGQILTPAVHSIPAVSTLNGILTLDGLGDPNACFIFQLAGAFNVNAGAKIVLINGAQACKVFWKIDGATSMAAGASFKGTIVCSGAIELGSGDILEGRALSVVGAVTVTSVKASAPSGCGSPILTGPLAPTIGTTACFALLTTDGALTNTGITHIIGDIGTNNGPLTGFNPLLINGTIHAVPDASTAQASADLLVLYTYLNTLTCNIELLYPVQFGNSQVLTPHVYCMNSAAYLTDTIFLDAQGNPDAVFVILINGALTTSTYSNVVLLGEAKSSNVFWKVEGSVDINDYSIFRGTIVANNGAISMFSGDTLDGRALSTTGAITTHAITISNPPCGTIYVNGKVTYENGVHSPMSNTIVSLKQNNTVVATTTTSVNGNYSFSGVLPGTYQIDATTSKAWGGVNSTDALLVLKHFVGTNILTGLALKAADVNGVMGINSTDALMIAKRYVNLISSFPVGNWIFDKKTITVSSSSVTNNFTALCYGDVNGSYLPSSVKIPATTGLTKSGILDIQSFSDFYIPVITQYSLDASAISLIFNYPEEILKVIGVMIGSQQLENTQYFAQNGELRISWFSLKALQITAGSELLKIQFHSNDLSQLTEGQLNIILDGTSEVSDENANIINEVMLTIPQMNNLQYEQTVNVFPNPCNDKTQIIYVLAEKGNVDLRIYNTIGNEVAVLVENQLQNAGAHMVALNASNLSQGIYAYRLQYGNNHKVLSGKLIINH